MPAAKLPALPRIPVGLRSSTGSLGRAIVLEALEHNPGVKKGRMKENTAFFFFFFPLKEICLVLVGQKQFIKPGLRESAKDSLPWVLPLKLKSVALKNGCGTSRYLFVTHFCVAPVHLPSRWEMTN